MVPTIGFSLLYALLRGVLDDVANYQICYGAIVGEDAQTWSGVATVGRKAEWPGWTPTESEKRRLGPLPTYVEGGAHNPMGARGRFLKSCTRGTRRIAGFHPR